METSGLILQGRAYFDLTSLTHLLFLCEINCVTHGIVLKCCFSPALSSWVLHKMHGKKKDGIYYLRALIQESECGKMT